MGCEQWRGKLDAYVDGELDLAEARVLAEHVRTCPSCAADALERVQMKRSLQMAGKRYAASAELRNRVAMSLAAKSLASKPRRNFSYWQILAAPALVLLILSLATNFYMGRENARRQRVYSELADLHVAALASATPVDVVSTDRHTVKPWFQGKIPFSFNLPELQGSQFTLLGGRITYFAQTPGAHLIFQLRKHEISVFIFQDRAFEGLGEETPSLPAGLAHALSFNVQNWSQNGLRYFVVGDVSVDDIQALSKLLRDAG
jgi:anti-sigma factor RsiW